MARIVIIDDSATTRRAGELMLREAGYEVYSAADGFEAMSLITEHKPDLIFVDIMMPRLDGYQTCALIKNNRYFKSTPVVMLSSKDGLFDRARGRIAGSERHIRKPFSADELVAVVKLYTDTDDEMINAAG